MKSIYFIAVAMAMALGVAVDATAQAQAAPELANSANPELVGALSKELGATPTQAEGAAGALFGAAKTKMPASDWAKVSSAVPGMDGLLKAATAGAAVGTAGASGAAGAAAAASGMSGGLGGAAAAFSKLGLKPEMVAKAVPVLVQYVSKPGGAGVGSLLSAAMKESRAIAATLAGGRGRAAERHEAMSRTAVRRPPRTAGPPGPRASSTSPTGSTPWRATVPGRPHRQAAAVRRP